MDSTDSKIKVYPKTGTTTTDIYTFTLNALYPNGHTSSADFVLGMNAASSTCDSSETISGTYSGTASYSYSNTGTQATGEVLASDFTASGGCTKRYTTTISPANLAKIWPRGDGRGAEWNSSDPAFAQTFTVTVQATIGCSNSATVSYDVVFGDNCAGDTFTIDPSKFSSNPTHALTYNLYDS